MKTLITAICSFLLLINYSFSNPRTKFSINENWRFKKGDIAIKTPAFNDPSWQIVNIPHCWNAADAYDDTKGYYAGVGWYNKVFQLSPSLKGKRIYVYFEGANQVAEVFINGERVGVHKGGYTAFTYDITEKCIWNESKPSANEISVKLDNSINENIPPLSADFTFYGGIYRDVSIIATDSVHFNLSDNASTGFFIQTPTVTEDKASVRFFGQIYNKSYTKKNVQLTIKLADLNGNILKEIKNTIQLNANALNSFDFTEKTITGYKLWSPEEPNLYKVTATITDLSTGVSIDEVSEPLGFRYYSFDAAKGFFLNGKSYKLIGANRHQDYMGLGNALPDNLHLKDMKLLKETGLNYLRIAHYPQDKAIVEACDKLGIIASIEIPLVDKITESQEFYDNTKNMAIEMQKQYYNHPSIFIWCYMNELLLHRPFQDRSLGDNVADRERVYLDNMTKLAQDLHNQSKLLDPYRPTMFVHHQWFLIYNEAKLVTIPDIIGWNLYPGWYGNDIKQLDTFLLKMHRAKAPTKPVIITEYGAGADIRIRTNSPIRYDHSVEWMNYYHEYYLNAIKKYDFVSGSAIWNQVDFGSEGRKDVTPHINNKGMFTMDRKPKDVAYFYKANLSKKPFVKIAPVQYENRVGLQDSAKSYSSQKIWVYTNLEKVELYVNRKPIVDKVTAVNGIAYFTIPFVNGENIIEAIAVSEGLIVKDLAKIQFTMIPLNFADSDIAFKCINVNCGAHFNYTDNTGQLWMPDKAYQKGNYGFIGGETYYNNTVPGTNKDIWGTLDEPLYQTARTGNLTYKFDVKDGEYEIYLHLAEILSDKEMDKLSYNLGNDAGEKKLSERVFTISVNNKPIAERINLTRDFGENRAGIIKIKVTTTNNEGINLDFKNEIGASLINGIQIRSLY